MTGSVAKHINWTLEHRAYMIHPVDIAEILDFTPTHFAFEFEDAVRTTWVGKDGQRWEAVLFDEFVQKTYGSPQPTIVFATAIKHADTDMSGYYTRVRLPNGNMYRYPVGANPLESPIQVLNPDGVTWDAPRPPLTPDEYEKLYVMTSLV